MKRNHNVDQHFSSISLAQKGHHKGWLFWYFFYIEVPSWYSPTLSDVPDTHMSLLGWPWLSVVSRSHWSAHTRNCQRRPPWRGWWWGCRWSWRWPCRACCPRWWWGRCPWTRPRRGCRGFPRPRRRSWPCRPRSCSGWEAGWWWRLLLEILSLESWHSDQILPGWNNFHPPSGEDIEGTFSNSFQTAWYFEIILKIPFIYRRIFFYKRNVPTLKQ